MSDEHKLEEELLSQEAKRRLYDQLDKAEKIDVDVQTDLLKVVQGQLDGVSVTGQGLVIKEDIRVQEIKIQTDSIAVNPFRAILGQIELNEPVNAMARVTLTEVDINRTLLSDFTHSYFNTFNLDVDGEIVSFELQETQMSLPGDGKMEFRGKVLLKEKGNTRPLAYMAMISPRTRSQPILLESFRCIQGEGISLEIITALIQKAKELVDLNYFEFEDMALRVKSLNVQKGSLILLVEAKLKQIPS
ncbi:MAG: DUF2993 domain-containing protein [Desmonostoc vinosum HA7617-LM4]|jgi:hypothetical protein|nr:DUF2993 domain-containing protein [Desmonostoc vinosum HA7617-LM4]